MLLKKKSPRAIVQASANRNYYNAEAAYFLWTLNLALVSQWHFSCVPASPICKNQRPTLGTDRFEFIGTFTRLKKTLRQLNSAGFNILVSLNNVEVQNTRGKWSAGCLVAISLKLCELPEIWIHGVKPQIIIETSPGQYQCFFKFDAVGEKQIAEADNIKKDLVEYYGGELPLSVRAESFNLPGFANHDQAPFICRLVVCSHTYFRHQNNYGCYDASTFSFLNDPPWLPAT